MTNYQNSKIYKITDNTTDMVYVGSTFKTLQQRLKAHEAAYKSFKAGKFPNNVTVFKILENADYNIVIALIICLKQPSLPPNTIYRYLI